MITRLMDKLKSILNKNTKRERESQRDNNKVRLSGDLGTNLKYFRDRLGESPDIVIREFKLGFEPPLHAAVIYIDGLVDKHSIHEFIMKSLMQDARPTRCQENFPTAKFIAAVKDELLNIADVREETDANNSIQAVLSGDTALLIEGSPEGLVISTRGWETRDVSEPITEGAVRGPREGFTETLRTNTALLRRRLKSPELRIETRVIGRVTRTDVALVYLKGLATEDLVAEVRQRLNRINTDSVLESGYLEEFILDHPYTPFPLIEHSERPDKIAAALLEGRVAIMVDGTPFVLIVPTVLFQFLQAAEDYYERYYLGTALRWGRFMGLIFALYLPSLYLAVVTMHHELLPTTLALSIAGAREGVPYPAFVEVLLMELAFEALREAGIRLPRPVGQAVSIVGALIIGDAAVRAGLVSSAMVIIVAFTGIASFTVPSFKLIASIRGLRLLLVLVTAVLGFPGIIMFSMILLAHLASLRSFGVPYLSPVAPLSSRDLKDILVRAPWWAMSTRPESLGAPNHFRQGYKNKPLPREWTGAGMSLPRPGLHGQPVEEEVEGSCWKEERSPGDSSPG